MKGFVKDIENLAVRNQAFRKVLYTATDTQLVLMTLGPGEEIGTEVHELDLFFRVEEGTGEVNIDGVRTDVHPGFGVLVPSGVRHNLVNTGSHPLKIYTLYSPPNHRDGVVHATRADAKADPARFDGSTTERAADSAGDGQDREQAPPRSDGTATAKEHRMATDREQQRMYGIVSATTIIGETVVDREGEKLGKIEDLMLDAGEGRLAYAVLSFGSKHFAVPWPAFEFSNTEQKLILNVDSKKLESAPGFDKDGDWPDFADRTWGSGVHEHYGAKPYWG